MGDVPINESYLMSIRMTKGKKVSSGIWGVEHKVLVSVKGTNHVAYFMFPVTVSPDTFCKSLGTNGLTHLKTTSKVFVFYLINEAIHFQPCKRFTACHEYQIIFNIRQI